MLIPLVQFSCYTWKWLILSFLGFVTRKFGIYVCLCGLLPHAGVTLSLCLFLNWVTRDVGTRIPEQACPCVWGQSGGCPQPAVSRRENFANLLNRYFVLDLAPSLWAKLSQEPLFPLTRYKSSLLGVAKSVAQGRGWQGAEEPPLASPGQWRLHGERRGQRSLCRGQRACAAGTCGGVGLALAVRAEVIWGS